MPVRTVDYTTQTFLPPCPEDYVGPDHPARYIRDLVDSLELEDLGFDTGYEPDGRARYAADTLLKLWLYGYYRRIRSSRQLEAFCADSMGALWLCGMQVPDHTTLWRFWNRHTEALGRLFKYSVQVALKAGLVDLALVAIDGTTIASCSSRRTGWSRRHLADRLERLDAWLKTMEAEIRRCDQGEDERAEQERSVQSAVQRRAKIAEAIAQLDKQGVFTMHPHEPDAALMNCDGHRQWAWNCQAAVDEKCGVVVATQVTNEANDGRCLKPMMDAAVVNLDGRRPQLFAADSAYGRWEAEVHESGQAGHTFVTARIKEERTAYHRSKFVFDRASLQLTCPAGYALKHTGASHRANGRAERFRCLDWKRCGAGAACHGKSRCGRRVEISPLHEVMAAHRSQHTDHERRMLMRRRLKTVEPVFARRKAHDGFRRFAFRGRRKVSGQWDALNLMHNLKLLLKAGVTPRDWANRGGRPGCGPEASLAGSLVGRLVASARQALSAMVDCAQRLMVHPASARWAW